MPLSVDYSTDGALVDGVELITLTPKNATGDTPVTNLKAVRTSVTEGENPASPGSYTPEPRLMIFFVWTDGLGSTVPDPGDWVTDAAGVVWTVFSAALRSDASQWRLLCRQGY